MSRAAADRLARLNDAKRVKLREEAIARSKKRAIPLIDYVAGSYTKYDAGWVHQLICKELEAFSAAVARGESPRLMIFMPPRTGKSFISSERYPVWHLGHYPEHQIVVASHSQALSNKFSRRARQLAASKATADTFPELAISSERKAVSEWETTAGGGYKAVGIGGGLTGSGAHVLIIDDVVKDWLQADSETHRENAWDWYTSTGYTRLAPGAGVLLILTRWHEDDLAGRILAKAESDPESDQWKVIRFPALAEADEYEVEGGDIVAVEPGAAIDFDAAKARLLRKRGEALHPARYNAAELNKKRKSLPGRIWLGLYQQRPTSAEGQMFKRAWWQEYIKPPAKFDRIIQSWDFTFDDTADSDYVVGQIWGMRAGEFYLLDQVRDRMDAPTAIKAVELLSAKWPAAKTKLVEKKANGAAVMKTLKKKLGGFKPFEPHGSKEQRAAVCSPDVESGNVYIPASAPWVSDFVEECASFPKGRHDDQVDAMTQALITLSGYSSAKQKLNALIGRGTA